MDQTVHFVACAILYCKFCYTVVADYLHHFTVQNTEEPDNDIVLYNAYPFSLQGWADLVVGVCVRACVRACIYMCVRVCVCIRVCYIYCNHTVQYWDLGFLAQTKISLTFPS